MSRKFTTRRAVLLSILALSLSVAADAQETQRSVYAGEERREIKSLSVEEIKQLVEGQGMGLARVAELNHYPGPRHALELAAQLELTAEQSAGAESAFKKMRETAVRLGSEIVARERELDALFAKGEIEEARMRELTTEIAQLQGRLRATHLAAHLEMRRLLSPAQIKKYDELRGYATGAPQQHNHGHGKH